MKISSIKKYPKDKIIIVGFILFLMASFVMRLFIADNYYGYIFDIYCNETWALDAINHGALNIYEKSSNILGVTTFNYPPGGAYLYWLLGAASKLTSFEFVPLWLVKLPAVLFDIAAGAVIFLFLSRKKNYLLGLVGSAIFLLNPGVVINSSAWGQTDVIYSFFVFLAFIFTIKKRWLLAGVMLALGCMIKLQGIIFIPLLFFIWLIKGGAKRATLAVVGFLLVVILLAAPFVIAGQGGMMIEKVFQNSFDYTDRLSANAYNLWWPGLLLAKDTIRDSQLILGLISIKLFALSLFSVAYLGALWASRKVGSNNALVWIVASFIAFSFFMLPTEIHERYLYPFLLLMMPVIFLDKRLLYIYLAVSATYSINLLFITTIINTNPVSLVTALLNIALYIFLTVMMVICYRGGKLYPILQK